MIIPLLSRPLLGLILLVTVLQRPTPTTSQYAPGTPKFHKSNEDGLKALEDEIESHPDVVGNFKPGTLFANIDVYRTEIPKSQDYGIGIIINPCGENPLESNLPHDCCMNRFGDGEVSNDFSATWGDSELDILEPEGFLVYGAGVARLRCTEDLAPTARYEI